MGRVTHDGLLSDVLEGRMLGKRRKIQLIDDLLDKKKYTLDTSS